MQNAPGFWSLYWAYLGYVDINFTLGIVAAGYQYDSASDTWHPYIGIASATSPFSVAATIPPGQSVTTGLGGAISGYWRGLGGQVGGGGFLTPAKTLFGEYGIGTTGLSWQHFYIRGSVPVVSLVVLLRQWVAAGGDRERKVTYCRPLT